MATDPSVAQLYAQPPSKAYNIEALHGASNYAMWKVQMCDILTVWGMLLTRRWHRKLGPTLLLAPGTVTPGGAATAEAAQAESNKAWARIDRDALTQIRLRCTYEVIGHIQMATRAYDAWRTLSQLYETHGALGIILAAPEVLPDGSALRESRLKVTCCCCAAFRMNIAGLGKVIEDDDFAITLLTSLPESWNPFLSSVALNKSTDRDPGR